MNRRRFLKALAATTGVALTAPGIAAAKARVNLATPAFWKLAPTPPMGWNSYDTYGSDVTESEYLANAAVMQKTLLHHGYNYAIIDYLWFDPTLAPQGIAHPGPSAMDAYGRMLPAVNKFPSAAHGRGFRPLSEKIMGMGLKFGFHVMRGIPREAVAKNTPIEGSHFHARDAANTKDICSWDNHMVGVRGATAAGQAYYDSIMRLYHQWNASFLKIDDLSRPYHEAEIHAIRRAMNHFLPKAVLSASPGATPVDKAVDISHNANMWRIRDDFWDNWGELDNMFDLVAAWKGFAGPGHWPDCDMICLGRIGLRSVGGPRFTHFTMDEQRTLMSLWALAPSPLILGMNLTQLDPWTLSLIANPAALAISQDILGAQGARVSAAGPLEVWAKPLHHGALAVGLFNRGNNNNAVVTAKWSDLTLRGPHRVLDVWGHRALKPANGSLAMQVSGHGARLLRLERA